MRCRVDCDAWLAGRECEGVRVLKRERGVPRALMPRPAMSGTMYVTFVMGDEATVVAPRREACDADSASRCLALGVLVGREKFRSGSSGSM